MITTSDYVNDWDTFLPFYKFYDERSHGIPSSFRTYDMAVFNSPSGVMDGPTSAPGWRGIQDTAFYMDMNAVAADDVTTFKTAISGGELSITDFKYLGGWGDDIPALNDKNYPATLFTRKFVRRIYSLSNYGEDGWKALFTVMKNGDVWTGDSSDAYFDKTFGAGDGPTATPDSEKIWSTWVLTYRADQSAWVFEGGVADELTDTGLARVWDIIGTWVPNEIIALASGKNYGLVTSVVDGYMTPGDSYYSEHSMQGDGEHTGVYHTLPTGVTTEYSDPAGADDSDGVPLGVYDFYKAENPFGFGVGNSSEGISSTNKFAYAHAAYLTSEAGGNAYGRTISGTLYGWQFKADPASGIFRANSGISGENTLQVVDSMGSNSADTTLDVTFPTRFGSTDNPGYTTDPTGSIVTGANAEFIAIIDNSPLYDVTSLS